MRASSWKGLLAVLSYYRGRSPESRASLAVNQAPAHTESTVRRDPCALWLIVRVGEYRTFVCVDLSVEGEGRVNKPGEREREGSVTNEANITRPIQLNTRATVTVGKTEYF